MENQRPCPSCESQKASLVGDKSGFQIFKCQECRTIFTFQIPLHEEAEDYDSYYSEQNLTVPEFINQRLTEIIGGFDAYRENNRLLDIGFGAGSIMKVAGDLGWQPHGIEVSKPAVEQARKLGFEVFQGELSEAGYPDEHFDVVAASEILEHLPDPQKMLEEVVRILRPGGLFWATTPSSRGLSYRLMKLDWTTVSPPEHIQLFSKKGIHLMLKKAGFSEIKLKTFGVDPSEIIHHFRKHDKANGEFNRVMSGYQLNESLTKNKTRQKIKSLLNGTLNVLQMGDSLKIYAKK